MNRDLISKKALLEALRNNVLVDVTPSLEEAIMGQPVVPNASKTDTPEKKNPVTNIVVTNDDEFPGDHNQLLYWSNGLGELHKYGHNIGITVTDLPTPLQKANETIYNSGIILPVRAYLTEYRNLQNRTYGITLSIEPENTEYTECTSENHNLNLYTAIQLANSIIRMTQKIPTAKQVDCKIFISKRIVKEQCEINMMLPSDADKNTIEAYAEILAKCRDTFELYLYELYLYNKNVIWIPLHIAKPEPETEVYVKWYDKRKHEYYAGKIAMLHAHDGDDDADPTWHWYDPNTCVYTAHDDSAITITEWRPFIKQDTTSTDITTNPLVTNADLSNPLAIISQMASAYRGLPENEFETLINRISRYNR